MAGKILRKNNLKIRNYQLNSLLMTNQKKVITDLLHFRVGLKRAGKLNFALRLANGGQIERGCSKSANEHTQICIHSVKEQQLLYKTDKLNRLLLASQIVY